MNEIYPRKMLLDKAIAAAVKMAHYPKVSFQNTKKTINKILIDTLLSTSEDAKNTHRVCFAQKSASNHFMTVLGDK